MQNVIAFVLRLSNFGKRRVDIDYRTQWLWRSAAAGGTIEHSCVFRGSGEEVLQQRPSFQIVAIVLGVAMLAAPFLALLFHPVAGLIVMAIALGATAILARDIARDAPVKLRRWLQAAMWMNVVFVVVCLLVAILYVSS